MARSPILLSLLGDSGAGKTTLAVALVDRWRSQGRRVGFLKHASHGFEVDRPGKDSARVAAAGAQGVVLAGPQGVAFLDPEPDLDPRRLVRRFLAERDVVVLEGFRDAALPSVLVVGPRGSAVARAAARGPVLAYVRGCDAPDLDAPRLDAPAFDGSDVAGLATYLEARLRLASRMGAALAS